METKTSFIENLRQQKHQESLGVSTETLYSDEIIIKKIKEFGILRSDLSGIKFNSRLSIAVNYTINSINLAQIFKKSSDIYNKTIELDAAIQKIPQAQRMDFCIQKMQNNEMFLGDLHRNGKVIGSLGPNFLFKPYNASIFNQNKMLIDMVSKKKNPEELLRRGVIDIKMINHPNYSSLREQLKEFFPNILDIIQERFPYYTEITNAFKDQTMEILLNENITKNIPDWLDITETIDSLVKSFEPEPKEINLDSIISDTEKLKIADKILLKRKGNDIVREINNELSLLKLGDKNYISKGILKTKAGKSIFEKLRKEIVDYKKELKKNILQTMGDDIKSVYILPKPIQQETSPRQVALMERYRLERQDISIRKASEKNRGNFENFKKRLGMYNKKTAAADLKIKKKFKRDNLRLRKTPITVTVSEPVWNNSEDNDDQITDAEIEMEASGTESENEDDISDTEMSY